jgi:hypothetical protein
MLLINETTNNSYPYLFLEQKRTWICLNYRIYFNRNLTIQLLEQ